MKRLQTKETNTLNNFWYQPLTILMQQLKSNEKGLSSDEAKTRLKTFGPNQLVVHKEPLIIFQLLRKFTNPLVMLLIITSVAAYLLQQTSDFIIINTIVILSVFIDFFQEYSANRAAKKLSETMALQVFALRNGNLVKIMAKDLVIGDIVHLEPGDLVPADGRIIESNHLFINQSSLTGESFPIEKTAEDLKISPTKDSRLENATNSVFMGTAVISGEGKMIVSITGAQTSIGKISETLSETQPTTQFEIETKKFGYFLMKITVFVVTLILIANLFILRPWIDTFLFALALAVCMTPEFLPMIMSVALARGAKMMAKKKAIVKRMTAIHDLGNMNVLCTDKTGTLTEAKIELARHIDGLGADNDNVMFLAYVNSYFETGLKNPLDEAILANTKINVKAWKKIDELPFDFERRRVSVLVDNGKERMIVIKGAPEDIISLCTSYEDKGKTVKMNKTIEHKLLDTYHEESKNGFRTLGIAWQKLPKTHDKAAISDEHDMVFAGFASFYDPPKKDAGKVIKQLAEAGVAIYILTGDSSEVTTHLCNQINIPIKGVLEGQELDKLDFHSLNMKLKTCNLFCRVTPLQKQRIVMGLKHMGFVVGYMGDGINDAPSLHSANIGISVNTATSVAKEAAEIILLRKHLGVVLDAVFEGRKIFANIIKYIKMMTSCNFGNMCSMAIAAIILPFLPALAVQLLLNNLLYDSSQAAVPFDNVDPEQIQISQKWNLKQVFRFMLVLGPVSTVFDLSLFFIMYKILHLSIPLFQTGWFMESLASQVMFIFLLRTQRAFYKSTPRLSMVLTVAGVIIVGLALPYLPIGSYFGFVPPPMYFMAILAVFVVMSMTLAELVKRFFYAKLA